MKLTKNIKMSVQYSYPKSRFLSPFMSVNQAILKKVANGECSEKQTEQLQAYENPEATVKQLIHQIETELYGTKPKAERFAPEEDALSRAALDIINDIIVYDDEVTLAVGFKTLSTLCSVYTEFGRGSHAGIENIMIVPEKSKFTVKDFTNSYGNEKYSVAFDFPEKEMAIAFIVTPSDDGIKGNAMLQVMVRDYGSSIRVGDAQDYMNVEPWIRGVSS